MNFLLEIGFLVIAYLVDGLALKLLWNWFMVPTFGMKALSLVQAIGVGIVVGFMVQQHIPRDEDARKDMMVHIIFMPIITIIIGYIAHLFM